MTARPEFEAARLLLSRLGVTLEQLVDSRDGGRPVPTFAEYIERVSEAVPAATRQVYGTYWARTRKVWGERRLDEPTALEIRQLVEQTRAAVVVRRNSRGGLAAAEHLIGALRCLYRHAVADGLISEHDNPALRVAKPRRLPSTRRALSDAMLAQINTTAATTGNDPELDTLLLRLHEETACRRGGALALRTIDDLDTDQCLVRLREKGGTERWQPVSPTLAHHLRAHNASRADGTHSRLLCYRDGRPLTARRYDHLWTRLGRHLPGVATQQVSTHWLRHTTLTWVERHFGYAVARGYAGHTGQRESGVTSTYVRADLVEIARALSALTGESHPLAAQNEESHERMPLAALG